MKPATWYDKWELIVPDHIADWDVLSYWEQPRTESMAANLKWGDLLFDIGSEHGALSALYARFIVGGDAMVLCEPSPALWRNIRLTWWANVLPLPAAMVPAFIGADLGPVAPDLRRPTPGARAASLNDDTAWNDAWPPCAAPDEECPAMAYASLASAEDYARIPTVSVDSILAWWPDLVPRGLTIDVEGAELYVLMGAEATLRQHRPLCWVSIHDDLARASFSIRPGAVRRFMADLGYEERHIATDHEQHWLFYDPARPVTL